MNDVEIRFECLKQAFNLHPTQMLYGPGSMAGAYPSNRISETKVPPKLEDVVATAEKLFAFCKTAPTKKRGRK